MPESRKLQLYLIFTALVISALLFIAQIAALWDSESIMTTPAPTILVPTTSVSIQSITVQPIQFSLIMWSKDSAMEGTLLIKSIIMYTSRPVDIHIICDDDAESLLRSRLNLVTRPRHRIRVTYYKPSWQSMVDRVEREGSIQTDHSAGLPGLMKLFIHEILPPAVTKSIFVDTDAIFISDPALLWEVLDSISDEKAVILAFHPDQYAPEWNNASKICSCVMLLDLDKLRRKRLMGSTVYRQLDGKPSVATDAFRAMYGEPAGPNGRYDNVRLGDQGYWWAIADYRPDLIEPMSFDFEVTSCLLDTYLVGLGDELMPMEQQLRIQIHVKDTPQEGRAVLPKLLHFNCLHGTSVYMEWPGWSDPQNALNQRWGPAVQYHYGYKWIWLNQGRNDSSPIEMQSITNVVFADELNAMTPA